MEWSRISPRTGRTSHLAPGYIVNGAEDTSSEAIRSWAPAYENYTFTATLPGTKLTIDQDITDAFASMPEYRPLASRTLKALCEVKTWCRRLH